jgi:hypothetical protein
MAFMYRFWHGPIIGKKVGKAWSSFRWCLFLEFGTLTPGDFYVDRKGTQRQYRPKGEWSITSMDSWPSWDLFHRHRLIASSLSHHAIRQRAFRLLAGRRLPSLEVDQRSKSTRLHFSFGFELETRTCLPQKRNVRHWLLQGPQHGADDWPHIALKPWT